MTRKKSLKKSKTRSKKYRAPCKRTRYSCSKGGFFGRKWDAFFGDYDETHPDDPKEVERYVKERE